MTTYYHLQFGEQTAKSPHSLILQPSVPKRPFEDEDGCVIEDDFTPRVCVGPSIEICIAGLQNTTRYYDVYETVGNVRVKKPITVAGPKYQGIGYTSPKFRFHGWLEAQEKDYSDLQYMDITKPKNLPKKLMKQFQYCVPDARETGELWCLSPVRVKYLGVYDSVTEEYFAPDITSERKVAKKAAAELRKLLT